MAIFSRCCPTSLETINLPTKERISRKAKHTRESRESNIFMRQSCAFSPELMKVARANPSAEYYLKIPRLKQRIRPARTRGIRENLTPRKSYPRQQFLSVLRLHVRMIYARLYTRKITRELLIKTNRINIPLNQLIVTYLHETLYTRCTYLIRQIVADANLLPRLYVASNGVTFVYYIRRTFGSIVGIKGIVHLLRVSPSNLVMRYA